MSIQRKGLFGASLLRRRKKFWAALRLLRFGKHRMFHTSEIEVVLWNLLQSETKSPCGAAW